MDKCMFYTVSDCNSQHTWEDQICRNFVAREAHGLDSISPSLLLRSCVFRIWVINPEMNHVPTHRFIALLDTSRELLFMHEHELERERYEMEGGSVCWLVLNLISWLIPAWVLYNKISSGKFCYKKTALVKFWTPWWSFWTLWQSLRGCMLGNRAGAVKEFYWELIWQSLRICKVMMITNCNGLNSHRTRDCIAWDYIWRVPLEGQSGLEIHIHR